MLRKTFAALLVAVALVAAAQAVPDLLENTAYANCDAGDPGCGG